MFYITEDEVKEHLKMNETIQVLKEAFIDLAEGKSSVSSRERLTGDGALLNTMPAILGKYHLAGLKTYIASRQGARFVVVVFDTKSNDLLALIEANNLGRIRTGALPAMVSQLLLKREGQEIAVIGSGFQAETQLEGLLNVFDCGLVHVYSRHINNARMFARRMQSLHGVEVRAHENVRDATKDATVISSITDSNDAIFSSGDLGEKYHVNLCGGNIPSRREAAADVLENSDIVIVEHLEQSMKESGEIIGLMKSKSSPKPIELKDFMSSQRNKHYQKSVFKSMGVGLEDLAAAYLVLKKMGVMS